MKTNKKILVFISDGKKFLSLLHNGSDLSHGGWFWFTVTGSVEEGETLEEAAKREIKEETNLNTKEIFDLNWGSIYEWFDQNYEERNLLAFIDSLEGIKLDMQEIVDYKLINLDDFVKEIRWDDNKILLKDVLENALKRNSLFKDLNLVDYRK